MPTTYFPVKRIVLFHDGVDAHHLRVQKSASKQQSDLYAERDAAIKYARVQGWHMHE